jgi:hypothetical protein
LSADGSNIPSACHYAFEIMPVRPAPGRRLAAAAIFLRYWRRWVKVRPATPLSWSRSRAAVVADHCPLLFPILHFVAAAAPRAARAAPPLIDSGFYLLPVARGAAPANPTHKETK